MVSITPTAPSTVIHAPTPAGSQKDTSRTDSKTELTKNPVDKNLTSNNTSPDPEIRLRTKPDGTRYLVTVQEGVEQRQKVPLDKMDKRLIPAEPNKTPSPDVVKKSFDKSA